MKRVALGMAVLTTAAGLTITAPAATTTTATTTAVTNGNYGANAQISINRDVRFKGGTPVGGWTSLTLFSDGTYRWSGHIRDSGAPSYNFSGVCTVRFSSGGTFAFKTSGRLHGTFESGSRNHDWNKSGRIPEIVQAWRTSPTYKWNCNNSVKLNLSAVLDAALQVVGATATVISIVA
ncbi:hypothetical protein [Streptosporangium sp. NPDC049644]|uniref:hypothetical protein n=1 Tax=Streptosporangium sp. NPDC049644 TaxID=3155507 RepID=UPI00342B1B55